MQQQEKKKQTKTASSWLRGELFLLRSWARGAGWRLQDWQMAHAKPPRLPGCCRSTHKGFPLAKQLAQLGIQHTHLTLKKNPPQVDRNTHLRGCWGLSDCCLCSTAGTFLVSGVHGYDFKWALEQEVISSCTLKCCLKESTFTNLQHLIIILVLFSCKVFRVDIKIIYLHTEALLFLYTKNQHWGKGRGVLFLTSIVQRR